VISGFHREVEVGSSQAYSNREYFKEREHLLIQPALKFINSSFCPQTVAFRYDSQKEQGHFPTRLFFVVEEINF
jgi:hypothetical protein